MSVERRAASARSAAALADPPSLSVIVPVFNSEQTLPMLLERLEPALGALTEQFEVILVNDCSRDGSWAAIEQLVERYPFVRAIDLMRNYGQHNALLAGIRAAKYAICITIDDDLQHPPEEIAPLLAKLAEGYDVVYGVPRELQHGLLRNLASLITKLTLQNAMGAETASRISAFRAFRSQTRAAFETYRGSFVSIDVLLTWATTRFTSVVVRHDPRRYGASNYTLRKLLTHAVNMMTGFSALPLQLASMIGFGLTLLGLLVLCYVLGRYVITGGSVPGFPFLASIIAIFSGGQLFALGIIGEYLARVHFRLMDKPTYAVRIDTAYTPGPNERYLPSA
jgi:glycosyltransferase involved in cell wall biosynthesis